MQSIKILVVYHKQSKLVASGDFLPINAGRALAKESELEWLKANTIGDDTGENISIKNHIYNELTAVYWAWKNLDADFYGLMHYRRHFVFGGGEKNYYTAKKIGENYFEKIGYSPKKLRSLLNEFDFIVPKPMKRKSVYEHYKNAHNIEHLDAVREVIKKYYPDYATACEEYLFGQKAYFYNMFVFDKETFFRYCEFIFGVLEKVEDRFIGERMYVSERITGIFIQKLLKEGKKACFLPTIYIEKKQPLKLAIATTKANLKKRNGGGIRSFGYACKPLLEKLLPGFVFKAYRNRK